MKSIDRRTLLPLLGVTAVFFISRYLYDLAGIRYDGNTYLGYWQFIDPFLLRTDLWRSVYYLHSQPPLLNLFTGLVLQAFPANHTEVFHILFFVSGLILTISIYLLGRAMRFPAWLAMLSSAWFAINPGTVLYEHWLSYTLPVTAALALAGIVLHQFILTGKRRLGLLSFSLLAAIALTWSLFHILWLAAIVIISLIILPDRKKVLLAALVPVLLVTGWYAKNLLLVGEFTASSWAGMNLSRITTFRLSTKERRELVKTGELSKFALLLPFRNATAYLELLPDTPVTGIPILDKPGTSLGRRNQHHLVYVQASNYYLRDALRVIRLYPERYVRSIGQSLYIYIHSPSDFDLITPNRLKIQELDLWWNRLFFGQWQTNESSGARLSLFSAQNVGWWIAIALLTSIFGSGFFLWKRRNQLSTPENGLMLFMLVNILYVTLIGNVMEIGENNRFRFVIDPLILILFVFFIKNLMASLLVPNAKTAIEVQ
jgi:hypothetical protein